ncbi:hypothetical protein GQ43DRAFT_470205 [Delitschia confertaspora ATCC 74209]|uniref:Proteasome inhibitor PI31 subunit n=1 Tax=Delitschia confertaspora ATCC 74209 TaxID=1513339 RepID=A0A9P4JU14_9PLEO|nr:hypothetical protein GQ43DRAFT_470205 [Delitschia confertaspora ATCC 74209]
MAASLPKTGGPQLKSPYDAVALAVHAGMSAVGFRLIGLGEDHRIESEAAAHSPQPLPAEWNASSSYAFRYAHSQSSVEYIVKISRLGGKAVVFGIALGNDKTVNFDITVKDFISESLVPATLPGADARSQDAVKTLKDIFISPTRLNDLAKLLETSIIQKLAPGIHKEDYQEEKEPTTTTSTDNSDNTRHPPPNRDEFPDAARYPPSRPELPQTEPEPARPYPFDDPLARRPSNSRPLPEPIPGFEDEYEINRPARRSDPIHPSGNTPNIGHNDLYPQGLGPHDPFRPHLGGGLGGPPGGFNPYGQGGGMHPTFDDPMFGGQAQDYGEYNPMAPPGSRYDPVGPGDGVPRDPARGSGYPGGRGYGGPNSGGLGGLGGGGPPNPFGGFGGGDFI